MTVDVWLWWDGSRRLLARDVSLDSASEIIRKAQAEGFEAEWEVHKEV